MCQTDFPVKYLINTIAYIFIVLPLGSSAQPETEPVPYEMANTLWLAVSKVQTSHAKVLHNLDYCGIQFSHLHDVTAKSRSTWLEQNTAVLAQAERVRRYLINDMRVHASAFAAEKMTMDIDARINKDVEDFMHTFKNTGRKDQHYLCNRLILSIPDGEHDLNVQNASETKALKDFKP